MNQSIRITYPSNGATVAGTVNVTVATVAVGTVIYFVDGVRVHSDSSAPFTFAWDTTQLTNGSHSLKVTSGNGAVHSTVTVDVENGTTPSGDIWAWDVQSLALDPGSAAFITSMLNSTPAGYVMAMEAVGHRTTANESQSYERHGTAIDGLDANFWIPDGTLPGLSLDRHLAIVDDVTGRTQDMWKATLGTDGKVDTWKGGRGYPTSPVVAYLPQMVKSGANTTTNASNVPALPSILTPADVAAGVADHTLTFTCYHPGPGVATSATRGNRYPAAPYATPWPGLATNPPLGTMIRLPESATLSSSAGVLERCIFNSLKLHGAVLRDNGPNLTFKAMDAGGGGQGASEWQAVGVHMYSSGVLNSTTATSDRLTLIPWHELQVTVPPAQT